MAQRLAPDRSHFSTARGRLPSRSQSRL